MDAAKGRKLLTAGLLILALAVVTPTIAVGYVWTGSAWLAMWVTDTHNPVSLVFAVLFLVAPLIPALLVFAAVGVWRGIRGAFVLGWIGLILGLATALGPLGNISTVSWLPLGNLLLLGLALVCAVLLVRARPPKESSNSGRTWARLGAGLLAGYLVVVAVGVMAANTLGGTPNDPWFYLRSRFERGPAITSPIPVPPPTQNPFMAKFPWAAIHNDAAQSDLYQGAVGVDPATAPVTSFAAGGVCASLAWDSAGHLATVCVSDSVTAHLIDPTTMTSLASYRISERPLTADFFTNFGGGGYLYLDHQNRLVTPTLRQTILVLGQHKAADGQIILEPEAEFDLSKALQPDESPTSVLPDSSGRLWFVGRTGTVGYVDPGTGKVNARAFAGENIENSFAVGTDDDVYVVTSAALKRLKASAQGVTEVWSTGYETIGRAKPGQTSAASGTTPTLHGNGLVSIADNADQLHVLVYRITDGSRICQVPVFPPGAGATENSLIAIGADLVVENNYGYRLLSAVGGHSSEPGVARIQVNSDSGTCRVVWLNSEARVPSLVSKASAASGVILTYTKDPSPLGFDNWWLTALDLRTGDLAWRRLLGSGSARNNHYAAIYLGPDGGIYVGTAMGIVAIRDK